MAFFNYFIITQNKLTIAHIQTYSHSHTPKRTHNRTHPNVLTIAHTQTYSQSHTPKRTHIAHT